MKQWMGAVAIVAAGILPLAQAAPPATGPRFLEEHPEAARTTLTPAEFDSPAIEAELIPEPAPAEINSAVINSPRFREENPQLFRGTVMAAYIEETSPTAVTPRVVEEHPEIVRQNQGIEPETVLIEEAVAEEPSEDPANDAVQFDCWDDDLYTRMEEDPYECRVEEDEPDSGERASRILAISVSRLNGLGTNRIGLRPPTSCSIFSRVSPLM